MVSAHTPSEAETAFLHADYDKAVALYQAQLQQQPNDVQAATGLVQVLLQQQKVAEASDAVNKALAAQPKSAPLMIALGDVEYRQGAPWLAAATALEAEKIDACQPRLHLLLSRVLRLSSMYAGAEKEILTAHSLDPHDPDIRSAWIQTLPTTQRISELEAYLASPAGDDPDDIRRLKMYLESLKKHAAEPHKPCRLISAATSTEIPFLPLMRDPTHVRAFGLDVKLNGHDSHLEIDTGASGLVVSRSVAERAGLKSFSAIEMSGIGSHGSQGGYMAYADHIQVGSFEFQDCVVEVLDQRDVVSVDGLIGMDVFAQFLVTLDYPMRKLALGPLPKRPDEAVAPTPSLATRDSSNDEAVSKGPESEGGQTASATPAASPAVSRRPVNLHDRYVAPEMKAYTPVYRVGHNLLLPTVVNQSNRKLFILDSGAWTTTISPEAAREVTKLHGDDSMHITGISGKVDKAYTADNITLDFANLRQPARGIVSFDTSSISKHSGLEISGFIGATTLVQLTVQIDYRDGLVNFNYDPHRGFRPYW